MNKCKSLLFVSTIAALPLTAFGATVNLDATDSASVRLSTGKDDWNDNRLRSYLSSGIQIDGWMKFDLSTIPEGATVSSASLRLFSEGAFGTPNGSPAVSLHYSSHDAWSRGASGFPAGPTALASDPTNGPFPSSNQDSYDFAIDVSSIPWGLDNTISLILKLENTSGDHWTYWYGSGGTVFSGNANDPTRTFAPQLTINYSVIPEPSSALLIGLGALFLTAMRRRTK